MRLSLGLFFPRYAEIPHSSGQLRRQNRPNEERRTGTEDAVQYVEAGLPISYGVNYGTQYRRAAEHVDKILRGTKPGDLPIEQSAELDLGVNLRTAKAMGISIAPSLAASATKLIQ